MKNKILYLAVFALATFALAGCQKITTEGFTKVTHVPTIGIEGGYDIIYVGETYVDTQGYWAKDPEGKDITNQVELTNNVRNKVGAYEATYTVRNADGAPARAYRPVFVAHPTDIVNVYLAECIFGARHYYNTPIFVTDTGKVDDDGNIIYEIDDLLGGLQFNGINPGFEPTYDFHAEGNVVIAADNTVSQEGETGDYYFSASQPVVLNGGTFDPETRTWDLDVNYGTTKGQVILRAITK